MADYTGVTDAKTATLVADTADSVTFDADADPVSLVHHGTTTDPIFYTVGSDSTVGDPPVPTVDGDDCFVLLSGERLVVNSEAGSNSRVRLISAGANKYTVERG